MAELATIARPYAEAAFELARDAQALPKWSEMMRFAATIVGDPRVAEALDNPRLDAGAKASLLLSIAGDRFDGEARNFIRVLLEGERVMLLPQIATMFETLKDDAEAIAVAHRLAADFVKESSRRDRERIWPVAELDHVGRRGAGFRAAPAKGPVRRRATLGRGG